MPGPKSLPGGAGIPGTRSLLRVGIPEGRFTKGLG